jgi:hypothetical protein
MVNSDSHSCAVSSSPLARAVSLAPSDQRGADAGEWLVRVGELPREYDPERMFAIYELLCESGEPDLAYSFIRCPFNVLRCPRCRRMWFNPRQFPCNARFLCRRCAVRIAGNQYKLWKLDLVLLAMQGGWREIVLMECTYAGGSCQAIARRFPDMLRRTAGVCRALIAYRPETFAARVAVFTGPTDAPLLAVREWENIRQEVGHPPRQEGPRGRRIVERLPKRAIHRALNWLTEGHAQMLAPELAVKLTLDWRRVRLFTSLGMSARPEIPNVETNRTISLLPEPDPTCCPDCGERGVPSYRRFTD